MQKAIFSAQKKEPFSNPVLLSGMLGPPLYACSEDSVHDAHDTGPKNQIRQRDCTEGQLSNSLLEFCLYSSCACICSTFENFLFF